MATQALRCGLTIEQFWESTPWDLRIASEAYSERMRDTQEIHAGMTAALMNVTQQLKRPKRWTANKLIGPRKNDNTVRRENYASNSEFRKAIRELRKRQKDDSVW